MPARPSPPRKVRRDKEVESAIVKPLLCRERTLHIAECSVYQDGSCHSAIKMVGRRVDTNAHRAIKWRPREHGDTCTRDEPELSEVAQVRRPLVSDPRNFTDCADWQ